jgi:hypothetical protein
MPTAVTRSQFCPVPTGNDAEIATFWLARPNIEPLRHGRENTLELFADPLRDVARWILAYEQFWKSRLDRLEAFLAAETVVKEKRR